MAATSVAGAAKSMADEVLRSNPYLRQEVETTVGFSVLALARAVNGPALRTMTIGTATKLAAKAGSKALLWFGIAMSAYEAVKIETRAYKEGRCHF